MSVLVAYASKYGATQSIAERITQKLVASGHEALARPVRDVGDPFAFDAFVLGSAVYLGSWRKEATDFVRRHSALFLTRPVWLFSSGPLGNSTTDAQGRDLLVVSEPKELAELREAVGPRAHRVFFGALDPAKLSAAHRLVRKLPAGRALLPEGDFRDWDAIESWAAHIARELERAPAAEGPPTDGGS